MIVLEFAELWFFVVGEINDEILARIHHSLEGRLESFTFTLCGGLSLDAPLCLDIHSHRRRWLSLAS